jgi:hypothetical protein
MVMKWTPSLTSIDLKLPVTAASAPTAPTKIPLTAEVTDLRSDTTNGSGDLDMKTSIA